MSMTKQQKVGACLGGAFGLCVLALGWFLYSAWSDYQAAMEGDEEETPEGLIAAKEKNSKFYTQSNPFPSAESINLVKSNESVYAAWKAQALAVAARGDCPPPPSSLVPTVFKRIVDDQVRAMQKLPGGVGGRICADKFWFGFDQYLGDAGKTPEQQELPKLYAQFVTITNVVDIFRSSGVLGIRKIERVETQDEEAEAPARGSQRNRSGKGKAAQDEAAEAAPKRYDFNLEYSVRASAFVKVLNGLAKSPRFYVVSNFSFEQEGESLKARLDRSGSPAAGGASSRGRRGRDRDREKKDVVESGVVTNPETDAPILVRMKLSVYDFGKGGPHADAKPANDAPAPSPKEGK